MKNLGKIGVVLVVSLLIIACVVLYIKYDSEQKKSVQLKDELSILAKKENQSAVMQSINAQMEEIANQQRAISDEQRQQAEEQTKLANEQRQRAEIERQNALDAEERAIEASKIAKAQQTIAEQQRIAAESSKRIADTLSYINLGRSLGTLALNQYNLGNKDLGVMLSYAAYMFTDRYRGDVYNPSVYKALTNLSQSRLSWARHKGRISNIDFFTADHLVSVSTYGEIMEHYIKGKNLRSTTIFSNKNYDFRNVLIYKDNVYAVSRSGHLIVKASNKLKIIELNELYHPKGITTLGDQLLVIGEHGITQVDPKSLSVVRTRQLPFNVDFFNRYDYSPAIFDGNGRVHIVRTLDKIETVNIPVKGRVTAFASSKNTGLKAYGMKDGSIYIIKKNGSTIKLEGHRSQVSYIKINGNRLYSSSYDKTIKLWMCNLEKIEPIELFSTDSWILYFTFDKGKNKIWTADQNGTMTEELISVPMMVQNLKSQIKRNFTQGEWNYYIGSNVPYEKLITEEVRK